MADVLSYLAGMTPPAPQYKRGAGPNALPYGQAQGLNQASVGLPQPQAAAAPPAASPPSSPTTGPGVAASPENFKPADDLEKFIFTGHPAWKDVPVTDSIHPVNRDIEGWLGYIAAAARLPGASRSSQALYMSAASSFGPA